LRRLLPPLILYLSHPSRGSDSAACRRDEKLTPASPPKQLQLSVWWLRSTPFSARLEAAVVQEQLHELFGREVANSVTGWGEWLGTRVVTPSAI